MRRIEEQWPRRLLEGRSHTRRESDVRLGLRAAREGVLDDVTRAAVFGRAAAGARRTGYRTGLWAGAVAVAAAVLLVAALSSRDDAGPQAKVVSLAGAASREVSGSWSPLRADDDLALPARVRVARGAALALTLPRGARIEASTEAEMLVRADGIDLEAGVASHRVDRGRGRYVVSLGRVEVVVLGTRFWTGRSHAGTAVCVDEGRVEVRSDGRRVVTLAAGEAWRSHPMAPSFPPGSRCRISPVDRAPAPGAASSRAVSPQTPPAPLRVEAEDRIASRPASRVYDVNAPVEPPSPTVAPAVAPAPIDCATTPDPEACWAGLARGAGLAAERALYRLGEHRLRASDRRGALEAWDEHSRRFPRGVLAEEVGIARLEVHLASDGAQARSDADALLETFPRGAHAADVRVIRGTLRQRGGDPSGALGDFEAALEGQPSARRREEAFYGRAACLDRLGRTSEALTAYRAYLAAFPGGRFAEAAEARVRAR